MWLKGKLTRIIPKAAYNLHKMAVNGQRLQQPSTKRNKLYFYWYEWKETDAYLAVGDRFFYQAVFFFS
jgi:hypothetical protein